MKTSRIMTKDEYINWMQTRGEVGNWDIADCRAADKCIEQFALNAAEAWLSANIKQPLVRDYMMLHLSTSFGSVETDAFLQSINAYPNWM
jgi:hypothetical protein